MTLETASKVVRNLDIHKRCTKFAVPLRTKAFEDRVVSFRAIGNLECVADVYVMLLSWNIRGYVDTSGQPCTFP